MGGGSSGSWLLSPGSPSRESLWKVLGRTGERVELAVVFQNKVIDERLRSKELAAPSPAQSLYPRLPGQGGLIDNIWETPQSHPTQASQGAGRRLQAQFRKPVREAGVEHLRAGDVEVSA